MNALAIIFCTLTTLCGCGGPAQNPVRSPSTDYPPPPLETSDGQTVGADGVPPSDKLETGPRVGPSGVVPADQPPHREHKVSAP